MFKVAFLPGAGGKRAYWQPIARRLALAENALLFGWPGFGDEPLDTNISCLTDLVGYCAERLPGPCDVVAQSMGGLVALQLAHRHPDLVRRLVLCGTSGGIDMTRFEAEDWRQAYLSNYLPALEHAPAWFFDDRTDITAELASISVRTLLLWGADDRISPPAVGAYLQTLLPKATMVTVPGAGHGLTEDQPDTVTAEIKRFLAEP